MIFMHMGLFYNFLTNISQFAVPKVCFTLKIVILTFVLLMYIRFYVVKVAINHEIQDYT